MLSRVQLFETHELWPARLLCPWDSPGKNTGVDCIPFSRRSSWPRDRIQVSCIAGLSYSLHVFISMWLISICQAFQRKLSRTDSKPPLKIKPTKTHTRRRNGSFSSLPFPKGNGLPKSAISLLVFIIQKRVGNWCLPLVSVQQVWSVTAAVALWRREQIAMIP